MVGAAGRFCVVSSQESMGGPAPLALVLDVSRAQNAGEPYGFDVTRPPQKYLLHGEGGSVKEATLLWDQPLLDDLAALRLPRRDPEVIRRLGRRLRSSLSSTEWPVLEAELREAVKCGQPVTVTIRAAAAELYSLPWELLTIEATGQHIGELPGVLLRYEWPNTETMPQRRLPSFQGCRVLLAWSGQVPADQHEEAIRDACHASSHTFDVVPHVSLGRLSETLKAATKEGRPIAILHVLCHGAVVERSAGLAFNDDSGDRVVVDAAPLRQILAPHAATLRLVVLAACDSGDAGIPGNQMGSIAQDLHRAGIAAVVASRFPLSTSGSRRLAEKLYQRLLAESSTLEAAFLATRRHLAEDATLLDWAALQLYARAADGGETRLVGTRPLDKLRTPEVREQLSQFRALFARAQQQIVLLGRYKKFHDVLQKLERSFNVVERNRKRLLALAEAWDELHDQLMDMQLFLEEALGVLDQDRLRDEFDTARLLLADAVSSLNAAMAGDTKKLDDVVRNIRHVLGRDLSSADVRLLATVRELGLREVVGALRSAIDHLRSSRVSGVSSGVSIDDLAQRIVSLDELRIRLEALVQEHHQWQWIDNELRVRVDRGPAAFDESLLPWHMVRARLHTALRAAADADWIRRIDTAVTKLDGELDRPAEPAKHVNSLRDLWRYCNLHFSDLDTQLLLTCETLQDRGDAQYRVRDTLDAVLEVIDER